MIDSRDDKAAKKSQVVVSKDWPSTVSVAGFDKRAVKKDIDSLIARESSIISSEVLDTTSSEYIIPSDVRICDNL